MPFDIINVCAGIIRKNDKILICQRSESKFNGAWEFPGGKVEINESQEQALKRELEEELGIKAKIGHHFHTVYFKDSPTQQINLHSYIINSYTGQITCHVHAQYKWVSIDNIALHNYLPADLPIVAQITKLKKHP
ncbi:(deoxy)nucleoside triphosphate pyrophosphohydrolase [Lentisphaera profundi]|uniref:8-oxo-dGTP diphosphatase n=1 Tax=Lentisphaera profundi TaxID=1658616 RepID=A0ABY7VUW7_9BACT|nr:(deoxy)nucleoside triphosphate pyrophosphohydrolase [Lentisphaera profundi]WDE98013.1 (deoxy)nucleoside triphosphate pyrophosphohydrolase [Lentisphaera profundi]